MKILLVSATTFEIAPYIDYLEKNYTKKSFFEFEQKDVSIYILVTGVGAMNTAFAMARLQNIQTYDLAINVGVAGAFNPNIQLGTVFEVYKDRFADIGVDYVPEICIYQLKKRRPIEIFVDFVMSFGITVENRLEELETINADSLNIVISYLQRMDEMRRDSMADSRPIYRLLAHHDFTKVDEMIDNLKIG